jgi:hypothetical protein
LLGLALTLLLVLGTQALFLALTLGLTLGLALAIALLTTNIVLGGGFLVDLTNHLLRGHGLSQYIGAHVRADLSGYANRHLHVVVFDRDIDKALLLAITAAALLATDIVLGCNFLTYLTDHFLGGYGLSEHIGSNIGAHLRGHADRHLHIVAFDVNIHQAFLLLRKCRPSGSCKRKRKRRRSYC